jgi:hypothetical protein
MMLRSHAFQLMPHHWHLVLRPNVDGEMSRFLRWVTATHTMRYHAHYHTSGQGHIDQGRCKSFPIQDDEHLLTVCRYVEQNALRAEFVERAEEWRWGSLWRWIPQPEPKPAVRSSWPISRPRGWIERVNRPLTEQELAVVRDSIKRGCPSLSNSRFTRMNASAIDSSLRLAEVSIKSGYPHRSRHISMLFRGRLKVIVNFVNVSSILKDGQPGLPCSKMRQHFF